MAIDGAAFMNSFNQGLGALRGTRPVVPQAPVTSSIGLGEQLPTQPAGNAVVETGFVDEAAQYADVAPERDMGAAIRAAAEQQPAAVAADVPTTRHARIFGTPGGANPFARFAPQGETNGLQRVLERLAPQAATEQVAAEGVAELAAGAPKAEGAIGRLRNAPLEDIVRGLNLGGTPQTPQAVANTIQRIGGGAVEGGNALERALRFATSTAKIIK